MFCPHCNTSIPAKSIYCLACGRKQPTSQATRRHLRRPPAQGTITKIQGRRKPYWARLPADYANGMVERKSVGCYATYKEAAEALAKAMYLPSNDASSVTLSGLFERFENSNYFAQLSPGRQSTHRGAWKHLSSCASIKVNSINKETFQRPIDELALTGLKRGTLAKIRNLASLLCKEAMGLGLMTVNFGQLVQLPRDDTTSPIPFSSKELTIIWNAADAGNRDAMTVLVLCYTGMRPSELLGAKIEEHLHIDGQYWYLRTGSKTEAGRNRIIPIPELIRPFITALIDGRSTGPLIASPNGKQQRLDNWRPRCFMKLMTELNLPGHVPYSCRHTYSDIIRRRNVLPEIAMTILGHEDYSTTVEHYHTTTDEDIERVCSAVNDLARPKT